MIVVSLSRLFLTPGRCLQRALAVGLFALGLTGAAWGAEFRSVAGPVAVLFDGPSLQARKIWLAPRQMPLEVLSVVGQWVKVRDVSGDVAWLERTELSAQRTLVTRASASVRSLGQEGAEVVFVADRGVVLELADPAPVSGWVRVRHRDGASGWVRAADVWGL